MYPVTELFKSKIQENTRVFRTIIEIQHSQGVLFLYDRDLVGGSLLFKEATQPGEEFTIGGTVASDVSFSIFNNPNYSNIDFMGATVIVTIGLEVVSGDGMSYEDLKQYTYRQLKQFRYQNISGVYEYVPLGKFNVDDVNKQRNTIGIKAIDNMIELDKPYSLSQLSYPATLYQIYVNACNVCDIPIGTTSFPNMDYVVQEKPEGDFTFRDIIGYVAELAGCFAKVNRGGALELRWYKPSGITLTPSNRFNFIPRDDVVRITGVQYSTEDTIYIAGTDEYVVDLSDNPLLQGEYETVLPNIFNNVKDIVFTPYESSWQGNPAIEAGDMITQIDRDGNIFNTIVTHSTYKYRGASTLSAKGLSVIAKGYKGSTNKRIANIVRKEIKPIERQLTTLEQAQLNATQLIANMLGGYAIKTEDAFYIADNEDLSKAQKVWKWGLGGFGYSSTGVNGPYTTAITADGSIVAMLVAANIITADMVQTGILSSEDGSTWINLDNGSFNFKNLIKLENGQLRLESPDIPPPADTSGLEREIENIKDLNTTLAGSVVTIDGNRVRVSHDGTNQYSEMRADGFIRKWEYGEAKYLNDIYVGRFHVVAIDSSTEPPLVRVELPLSFRGRDDVQVFLIPETMLKTIRHPSNPSETATWTTVYALVESKDLNANPPYVDVKGVSVSNFVLSQVTNHRWYDPLSFIFIAIGGGDSVNI